ncbi:hypothetical protein FHN55_00885 [Streptomyces sp. NP160]|uniref:hypothetical protein n=1 Tax=Streptomyces sp. NP160 TaxID=2586637 RepID=UPI0011192919|nr:hypothetical protein [Streptomyces sp. NP160]TNM70270.1 hypothetical protein FHN55_00885 [Streptomyces sp. NP160]
MAGLRSTPPPLDLSAVPPDVRAAVEAALAGAEVPVHRSGRALGVLTVRPAVLEGEVLEAPRLPPPQVEVPEGVLVVATAMRLSREARRRLAGSFGPGYLVLDLHEAPASTDVLLVNPVSVQLLEVLQARFPRARVVVTEIEDHELGVDYAGPVGRVLRAGASAYLPPRPVTAVADGVRAHLEGTTAPALEAAAVTRAELGSAGAG